MSIQLLFIVFGLVLVAAVVISVVVLKGYTGRFTFDTKNGTRPRASRGEGNTPEVQMGGRFKMLTGGVLAVFAALTAKLWSMQMVSSDYYEELSNQNQTRTVTTPAPRGRILDRNGVALVTNRPSLVVAAYRDLADDAVTVRHLANVLGLPYTAVKRNIQDYSQSAQSLHTVASDVRRSTVAYIQEHIDQFSGVQIIERTERVYPFGSLACHVLGYTGTITSDQLKAQEKAVSDEDRNGAISYVSGDIVGQAGVEARYETLLQGIRGEQKVKVDSSGNVTGTSGSVAPEAGSDIKLTLDVNIQKACEDGLALGMERGKAGGNKADAGACLCMDVENGEILGMASAPSFDPSVFIGGISNDDWNKLNSEDALTPMLDRAISGGYMSASTVKPFSGLAALEYGAYTATQTTVCTGYWTGLGKANGRWCWLHSGHGTMNLRNGIVNSCDPVFYDIGKNFFYDDKVDSNGLQKMYRRWGLGATCGIDLPGEASGRVPDGDWKAQAFKDYSAADKAWNPGDNMNIAIGQGDILVTPLQMACAYAGIANGGRQPTPHVFLSAVARSGSGDAVTYKAKDRLTAKVASEADLSLVRDALKGVIYEESKSNAAHFTNMKETVAGKSGTGEKTNEDDYGWFIVYAPYEKPKYVVAALVERGGFGAEAALPAVRTVLGALYNEPDDVSYNSTDQTR